MYFHGNHGNICNGSRGNMLKEVNEQEISKRANGKQMYNPLMPLKQFIWCENQ